MNRHIRSPQVRGFLRHRTAGLIQSFTSPQDISIFNIMSLFILSLGRSALYACLCLLSRVSAQERNARHVAYDTLRPTSDLFSCGHADRALALRLCGREQVFYRTISPGALCSKRRAPKAHDSLFVPFVMSGRENAARLSPGSSLLSTA